METAKVLVFPTDIFSNERMTIGKRILEKLLPPNPKKNSSNTSTNGPSHASLDNKSTITSAFNNRSLAKIKMQDTHELLRMHHNHQIQISWLTRAMFQFREYDGHRDRVWRDSVRAVNRDLLYGLPPYPSLPPLEPLLQPPTYQQGSVSWAKLLRTSLFLMDRTTKISGMDRNKWAALGELAKLHARKEDKLAPRNNLINTTLPLLFGFGLLLGTESKKSRGEFFNLDPDIERTFRRRKMEQRNLQASTSSTMEEDNVFLEELPFPGNPPDGRNNNDGLPPPLSPPPGGNGRNRLQDIQPRVAEPHAGPVLIIQEPGPQVQQENPVNGILRNPPPPLNNNQHIEDAEQHIFRLANSKDNSMMDYAIPIVHQLQTGIRDPTCNVPHFELKAVMFQMLQNNGQFAGLSKEDPHAHLRSFLEIAGSFRLRGISDDALKLKLFPFSLSHHAKAWYNSLKPNSIYT
ncbi:hypothetical protein OSB04_un000383 [Centaurea solstitialis]|uniref:Reverse transcriptase domain-containing protein n=1 Tax=Centaurea solstitialis TaxID=347529 RepID=A0AA38SCT4_9ASTR|nr:hypothetical protein OSB04_un000383 [Centaurea solstitialis]